MKLPLPARLAVTACILAILAASCQESFARAGGGRSIGSRGTRTYRAPASPTSPSSPTYSQPSPAPAAPQPLPGQQPFPQRQGGFFRSLAGGLVGGLLGGMLFRSLGFGGGWGAGGGFGLFDILLIGGILYLIYRFVAARRQSAAGSDWQNTNRNAQQEPFRSEASSAFTSREGGSVDETSFGIAHIRQMDPSFSDAQFLETAQDIFFRIQGAWTRRDLTPAADLLTPEMQVIFRQDIDAMKQRGEFNRLENIAVREARITEVWQEEGRDYLTVHLLANLLDYTTDESGKVISGSDVAPVKFEEYWTFTRPVGPNPWKLSAIQQS
ncbi:Tim44 domain-containing protein [Geobacter pickeringii]|uniref:Transporter n=1 Tax=Geobacter pickeringii TaxID=345632 RepID=A0A0B5BGL3_9BACT|nr:Tim44 domain-containing protein [Geobacter pickeringii]AJE03191.1 transporter [Geobacter pickeringii]